MSAMCVRTPSGELIEISEQDQWDLPVNRSTVLSRSSDRKFIRSASDITPEGRGYHEEGKVQLYTVIDHRNNLKYTNVISLPTLAETIGIRQALLRQHVNNMLQNGETEMEPRKRTVTVQMQDEWVDEPTKQGVDPIPERVRPQTVDNRRFHPLLRPIITRKDSPYYEK
jgi:hypothetical protein